MQLKLIICASLFGLCVLGLQAQTTIHVSPDGNGNGSSWQNPCSIQDAITNAASNDIIKLKEGVYNLTSTLEVNNTLNIYGGYLGTGNTRDPEAYKSILDGGGNISLMDMGFSSSESIINGIYFQDGFGSGFQGGALSIQGAAVKVLNCVFENNVSKGNVGSGAIYVRAEDVLIQSSRFQSNQVIQVDNPDEGTAGGAIHIRHVSNTLIVDCEFNSNTSYYSGGAIHSWGENTKIENCSFANNHSEDSGGAIYKIHKSLIIENCEFTGNTAKKVGGALANNNGPLEVNGGVFKGNSALKNGGGVHLSNDSISLSKVYFEDNKASQNGGALYNNLATVDLTDAVFWKNTAIQEGGAIYNSNELALSNIDFVANNNSAFVIGPFSTTKIYNSIFYANISPGSPSNANPDISLSEDTNTSFLDAEIRQNILQQASTIGVVQNNLINVDPLFINAAAGNFKLQHSSPGIDAGKASLYNSVSDVNSGSSMDLAGDDRLVASNIDLGAYEYHTILNCTSLINPLNGATDVAIDTGIQWNAVTTATGYRLSIGTTPGGTDLINDLDVGNITTYTPTTELPEDSTIYVRVVPYNEAGEANTCSEEQFTTETGIQIPSCTSLSSPLNGATEVAVDTNIQWNAVTTATGYRLSIGTTPGGTDLINDLDVGNITTYTPTTELPEDSTIYVRVVPYNEAGEANTCSEEQFTTETGIQIPSCTSLSSPLNGATDVAIDTGIQWNAVTTATGYRLSIGTTPGGTDLINDLDVGNITTYTPTTELPEDSTIYVRVVPYNEAGNAVSCSEENFSTETLVQIPSCTSLILPLNGATNVAVDTNIQWNAVTAASGYRLSIGTTPGGTDIINNLDVGDVTSFTPTADLPEYTTIYVRVIPYNEAGDANACSEENFSTETGIQVPNCTSLISPSNGATDVAVNTNIQWNAVTTATGYMLSIGTTAGGTDLVNNQDVGNVTTYSPTADFPEDSTIYVRVIPYNEAGEANGCSEENFSTETVIQIPSCTSLTNPLNGATDVAVDTNIEWNAVSTATGYMLSIGTTAGGTDLVNDLDLGNVTTYSPTDDFPEDSTIYVRVIPYNEAGEANGCSEENFSTETVIQIPSCTSLTNPLNGATDVAVDTNIQWNAVSTAAGYRLSIGTTAGGTDLVNNQDVGNVTTYSPTADFPEDTMIYVRVVPYNEAGEANACSEENFSTETGIQIPNCTSLIIPLNGATDVAVDTNIQWNAVTTATGYRLSIGTTAGGTDIINNLDVGNVTTYTPTADLPEDRMIYVKAVPYNEAGEANGCSEERFKTELISDPNTIGETKYGISPNGDSINDFWQISGIENFPDNVVSVFNRWGDMVYHVKGYDNQAVSFSGVANKNTAMGAGVLPSGTYFFKIEINTASNSKIIKGFIVLKR